MSFGFSVSDIYGCARLAYTLYDEFKEAPGACQEFARELLLFHRVLLKTKSTIESETSHLSYSTQAALGACLDSCKELLYVQIMGAAMVPKSLEKIEFNTHDPQTDFLFHPNSDQTKFVGILRRKFGERRFALRISKLQRAISAHIEKLTALNVLIIQSLFGEIQVSQERIKECVGESHDLLVKSSADHALQIDSLSDRLETSQTRIEAQLQTILANQQKSKTPIMSQSLNASSPEGHQTWMELGRLLRDEGITPAMIQNNRGLLVNVMKATFKNETSLAESVPESYATAPEYLVDHNTTLSVIHPRNASHPDLPSVLSPMSLLGSAPPRSAGFTDAFLERQNGAASSLDQEQNVDDGMESLLQGMSREEPSGEYKQDDMDCVELEDVGFEGVYDERQRHASHLGLPSVLSPMSLLALTLPRVEGYNVIYPDGAVPSIPKDVLLSNCSFSEVTCEDHGIELDDGGRLAAVGPQTTGTWEELAAAVLQRKLSRLQNLENQSSTS